MHRARERNPTASCDGGGGRGARDRIGRTRRVLGVGGWEGGVEVSSRNLQKYIAAQEAGSNRANSPRREIRVIVERFHGV